MDAKFTIGYKFCGNCNPYLDTPGLFRDLKKELREEIEFVYWENAVFDMLLIFSGCPVDCAQRPEFSGPTVVVAGSTLNYIPLAVKDLKRALLQEIKKIAAL
ncbi:MAG: hypothetical protein ACOWWO_18155 [Peptococcaceae bacterium]